MITRKRMLVVCAVVVLGLGLFSCTLEPTVSSPGREAAALPNGMPDGLSVSQPSITYDGATTILTYKVTADFSGWPVNSLNYTAEGSPDVNSEPQSIDALIHYYQAKGLFGTGVVNSYLLATNGPNGNLPPYVIIPLDTSLIRDWLEKKLKLPGDETKRDEDTDIPLVWIEENPVIGKVEALDPVLADNWINGTYQADGIRIGGIYELTSSTAVVNASTVENFDDGKDGRISSIATVLADETDRSKKQRYSSTINFYAGSDAEEITEDYAKKPLVPNNPADATGIPTRVGELKTWMKGDKSPVLRVVYEWAD